LLGDWELNPIVVILGEESGKAQVPDVKLEDEKSISLDQNGQYRRECSPLLTPQS